MCLIVDASVVNELVANKTKRSKVFLEFQSKRRIRIATCSDLKKEHKGNTAVIDFFRRIKQNNLLDDIDDEQIDAEKDLVAKAAQPKSNDLHVLALARISGARVIATDDRALQEDIGNKKLLDAPRGKVFSNENQRHLFSGRYCQSPK